MRHLLSPQPTEAQHAPCQQVNHHISYLLAIMPLPSEDISSPTTDSTWALLLYPSRLQNLALKKRGAQQHAGNVAGREQGPDSQSQASRAFL